MNTTSGSSASVVAAASTTSSAQQRRIRRNIIIDMETSDPDDLMNLYVVGGHPWVQLQAVTVVPGTPAQLLLVHEALNRMGSCNQENLGYLTTIPLGYANIDNDLERLEGSSSAATSAVEYDPYAATQGNLHKQLYPKWNMYISSQTGVSNTSSVNHQKQQKRKSNSSSTKGRRNQGGSSKSSSASDAKRIHDNLKSFVLNKIKSERFGANSIREGWKLLIDLCNDETTLITGGPLHNLGRAVLHSTSTSTSNDDDKKKNTKSQVLRLGRWCAQGGFAGYNVAPCVSTGDELPAITPTLPRFQNDWHNPAWNFDCSHTDTILALEYNGIRERFVCSKNVCHQVLYDKEIMHVALQNRVQEMRMELSLKTAASGGAITTTTTATDTTTASSSQEEVGCCTNAGEVIQDIPPSSFALPLLLNMMNKYRRADGKKLHDIVAGLCAIHPALSGCGFRKVKLDFIEASEVLGKQQQGGPGGGRKIVNLSKTGRWKHSGEWGCRYGVGGVRYFWKEQQEGKQNNDGVGGPKEESGREKLLQSNAERRPWNAWMSVDVDLERFQTCLVGKSWTASD